MKGIMDNLKEGNLADAVGKQRPDGTNVGRVMMVFQADKREPAYPIETQITTSPLITQGGQTSYGVIYNHLA